MKIINGIICILLVLCYINPARGKIHYECEEELKLGKYMLISMNINL